MWSAGPGVRLFAGVIGPRDPVGQAITYATNRWAALNRYVEDGDLAINNSAAERALRGVAVGRKNWLFWGATGAGERRRCSPP